MTKAKKQKYVLTRAIRGVKKQEIGTVIELTEDQSKTPFYRNRVRKADSVEVATPASGNVSAEATLASDETSPEGSQKSEEGSTTPSSQPDASEKATEASWKQPAKSAPKK